MWDELGMVCDLLETVEYARPIRLDRAPLGNEPAVYIWTYRGDRRGVGRRHLDLYRAAPDAYRVARLRRLGKGRLQAPGTPSSEPCRHQGRLGGRDRDRLRHDAKPRSGALRRRAPHRRLHAAVQPELATRGRQTRSPAAEPRMAQAPSPWALLHGRAGRGTGESTRNETQLWAMIEDHLLATVRCVHHDQAMTARVSSGQATGPPSRASPTIYSPSVDRSCIRIPVSAW